MPRVKDQQQSNKHNTTVLETETGLWEQDQAIQVYDCIFGLKISHNIKS